MKSQSQAYQDLWVLAMLNKKQSGRYLDIGCFDPKEGNNTWLLDVEFNWCGISIDHINCWNGKSGRRGIFVQFDASKEYPSIDYDRNIHNGRAHFDYLSLDVDEDTNAALPYALKFASYSTITIEHDSYARGNEQKEWQRKTLSDAGYILQVSDVHIPARPDLIFEDWWCSPQVAIYPTDSHGPNDAEVVIRKLWKEKFNEEAPIL